MLLRVDLGSTQPLHQQLAGQVRAAIAAGDLKPGDRLPPARELAQSLDVNVHTLLRALQTLRDEGLVEMRRGRGTTITAAAVESASVHEHAQALVAAARSLGMSDDEIVTIVNAQL